MSTPERRSILKKSNFKLSPYHQQLLDELAAERDSDNSSAVRDSIELLAAISSVRRRGRHIMGVEFGDDHSIREDKEAMPIEILDLRHPPDLSDFPPSPTRRGEVK